MDGAGRASGRTRKTSGPLVRGQLRSHRLADMFVQFIPLFQGIPGSIDRLKKLDENFARVNS
jgi:hypothetical protein